MLERVQTKGSPPTLLVGWKSEHLLGGTAWGFFQTLDIQVPCGPSTHAWAQIWRKPQFYKTAAVRWSGQHQVQQLRCECDLREQGPWVDPADGGHRHSGCQWLGHHNAGSSPREESTDDHSKGSESEGKDGHHAILPRVESQIRHRRYLGNREGITENRRGGQGGQGWGQCGVGGWGPHL